MSVRAINMGQGTKQTERGSPGTAAARTGTGGRSTARKASWSPQLPPPALRQCCLRTRHLASSMRSLPAKPRQRLG